MSADSQTTEYKTVLAASRQIGKKEENTKDLRPDSNQLSLDSHPDALNITQ